MTEVPRRLFVDADLRLDIDGVQAQVTGHGDRLDISTEHPARLLRAALPAGRTMGIRSGRIGLAQLRQAGLTVTLHARSATVLRAGADAGPFGVRPAGPLMAGAVLSAGAFVVLLRRAITLRQK